VPRAAEGQLGSRMPHLDRAQDPELHRHPPGRRADPVGRTSVPPPRPPVRDTGPREPGATGSPVDYRAVATRGSRVRHRPPPQDTTR
jgi:hypothetical protein